MTSKPNPIVFTYETTVSIGGPPSHKISEAHKALNRAYGFEDGDCNTYDKDGNIIAKLGGDNPELTEASYAMNRYTTLTIEISLHKNGHKTYRLKAP